MDTLSLTKEAKIYDGEKTNSLTSSAGNTGQPPVRNKIRVFTLTTTIQHSFGGLSHSNQRRNKTKVIQIGKEVKLSLFADDMVL